MKILKIAVLVFVALVVIGGAYVAIISTRFDLMFNDIVQEIKDAPDTKRWGDRVPLIPAQFSLNENRASALEKLQRAGFERVPNSEVWAKYQHEIEKGRELYTREADSLVCNIKIYVFTQFDEEGMLMFAEGTQHVLGCL